MNTNDIYMGRCRERSNLWWNGCRNQHHARDEFHYHTGNFDGRRIRKFCKHKCSFSLKGESNNWVNSVELRQDNTEPSYARSRKVRGIEGVTTRLCGNNNQPTKTRGRIGHEIVWTAEQFAEARIKSRAITIRPYSGKLDALSQWDVKRPVMQALKNDAVKTFDRAVQTQFNATRLRIAPAGGTSTTSLTLFTTGTCTSTNSAAYNSTYHKLLIDTMKERNIPPYLGDDYVAVSWPSTWRTLKNNMETLHAYTPPGLGLIMNGEIGRYETTRFVEQTNILQGVNNDGTAWVNGLSGWAYFFGEDTVMEGVVIPEEIRAKIPTDYGRSKGVAYYALMGWGIVQTNATDDRIVKWDSKA